MIPIASPIIEKDEIEEVVKVMKTGFIAQGPKVAEFEAKFADYVGAKYGIATNSGTAALHIALLAGGVGEGDEVITTPFTFAATGNSILYTGAKPVFVDIDPVTYNIDPSKIEEAITPQTKAIMPVHLYGQACNTDEINKIAEKHNLLLIEDAAQAHGASFNRKSVGNLGDMGCFSFYPTKNMTTAEGGIITTNNQDLAEKCRVFRSHGEVERYKHAVLGYNFRMTDMGAAIGVVQLKKIDKFNEARQSNAEYLTEKIKDIKGIKTPVIGKGASHVFHQYTIFVENGKRDELVKFLNDNDIGTGIHYPIPLYKQELYENLGYTGNCPIAEEAAKSVISLPIHPSISKSDLDTIAEVLKRF
ncbi:MAG: DegT/DnrJ/EryC1/StrS family aminotransferase [Methanobacteriaceae archaeon]